MRTGEAAVEGVSYRDRVRCAAVVTDGSRVLLVSYHFNDETFWSLPGGAPTSGESPEAAVRREVLEGTGLTLGPLALLIVSDHIYRSGIGIDRGGPGGQYHELGLYFSTSTYSGDLRVGDEPEHGGHGIIRAADWIHWEEIDRLRFYPSHLAALIRSAADNGFDDPPVYIEDRTNRDWIAPVIHEGPGEG
jgi:ADP-ribose pyrophosphatase YjhB (NUDIX family)